MDDFEYKQDKTLCNKKNIGRYGYSYKQRNKTDMDKEL
jgi:hypothetical protein